MVNFVFRAMVVFVIGSGIYGDEQVSFFISFSSFYISFPRAPSDVILDSPVVKTCVSTSSRQCTILDSGHSRFVFTLSFLIKIYFPFSFCLSVSQHSSLDLSRRTKKPKSKKLTCKFFLSLILGSGECLG